MCRCKWTVLADNRASNPLFETEHGLSILLETAHHRVLLDTGASDLYICNANRMSIDLSEVDYVFISHGHADHAGGLRHFLGLNTKARIIVSPEALTGEFFSKRRFLHSITPLWPDLPKKRLLLISQTCDITEGLHVIAHIPHSCPLPKGNDLLFVRNAEGEYLHDDFYHELALYADGLLFTGCAHSGLENILAACPWPVETVIGGFHLLDGQESDDELIALGSRLKENYPQTLFFTSHCTGDNAFQRLKSVMGEQLNTLQNTFQ